MFGYSSWDGDKGAEGTVELSWLGARAEPRTGGRGNDGKGQ